MPSKTITKNTDSWEPISRTNSKLETIKLFYKHDLSYADFSDDAQQVLISLEDKFGGTRCPVVSGSGGQFLPPVNPTIEILVSFVAVPFIKKYLDGLLDSEALKELGKIHRETVSSWFSRIENELETVIAVTNDLLKDYPKAVICRRQETDFILEVDLGSKKLRAVLNKNHSNEARVKLPGSIVKAVRYIVENQTDQYLEEFKLHFDFQSKEWCLYATTPIKLSN